MRLYKYNYVSILIHILLWVLFGTALLFLIPMRVAVLLPYQFWVKQICLLLILVVIYYTNAELLVPRLLLKNKIFWYITTIACIILLTLFVSYRTRITMIGPPPLIEKGREPLRVEMGGNMRPGMHRSGVRNAIFIDPFTRVVVLLVLGISTSVTLVRKWQRDQQNNQLLEQEKISSELSFLKAQINPHFFFNTLNNIYALTHVNVETSRTALHKLSRLMRYVLYDTQQGTAPLSKEIAFINDYIELMKLRLTDKVKVHFNPPHLHNDPEIASMILLPFIENAFKHGVSTVFPGIIVIELSLSGNTLDFVVINTTYRDKSGSLEQSNGIGLNNTRRRLNLLYPDRHTLNIEEDVDYNQFKVELKLKI